MPQRREIVERHVFGNLDFDIEMLGEFAEELCFFDAIDAKVGFKIGIEFHHFRRITRLLDDKIDQERFEFIEIQIGDRGGCRGSG